MRQRMAVLVLAPLIVIPVGREAVAATSRTTCVVGHEPTLTPGLSMEGTSGTFKTMQLGSISCDGPVRGITPTGPGTLHDEGRYGTKDPDSCPTGGEGEGAYTITFPTDEGEKQIVTPFILTFGDFTTHEGGFVGVHVRGEGMSGDLGARPTEGDCVSKPITKVKVSGELIFS
jgi:hypothetical protein